MKVDKWRGGSGNMRRLAAIGVLTLGMLACATPALEERSHEDVACRASELVQSHYRADAPGAVVLVARGDRILFRGARGQADIASGSPLQPDSVFRIGSLGKQFAAAALLTLVDDGRVALDDPLSRYLPDYPGGENITLSQLLNHTSGVRNFNGLPGYVDGVIRQDMTTAEIIDLFRNEPADFAPGQNWAYSNSGYVLIGAVIESVTGMPWHVYFEQRFFRPLGMRHTGYGHHPDFAVQQVSGYSYEGETVVPMRPMSMTQPHAAGALVSNVDDLLIWTRALHEGRILRNATYLQMITPHGVAAGEGIRYGFGLYTDTVRGHRVLRHGGHIFGFIASLSYLPGPDITIVVLENDDANSGVEEAHALARRLAAIALGEPYPEMTPASLDAVTLQAIEGSYGFDGDVTRRLLIVGDRLTAQRGVGPRIPLTPIGVDDFLYEDGFNRLRIERNAQGVVVAIRYFANGDGPGDRGARLSDQASAAPIGLDLDRAALERLVGVYANNQLTLTVSLEGEALFAQITDQPSFRLLATAPARFDVEGAPASIEFSSGAGPATELTIRQGGRETSLRRTQ